MTYCCVFTHERFASTLIIPGDLRTQMTLFAPFQLLERGFGLQGRYCLESGPYVVFFMPLAAMRSVSVANVA
ncbi:hypothetical protein MHH60_11495 [Paenibacillus sp. FSL H7-0716]|uniref:hypothetical protein n=1 Tax=Paenibacillus TaxID=44249 RepID=UPI00117EAB46|nr:hypothetical protein [Paenibacillus odorifer]